MSESLTQVQFCGPEGEVNVPTPEGQLRVFRRGETIFVSTDFAKRLERKHNFIVGDQRLCVLLNSLRKGSRKKVLIWRSYALGDLLMLHTVLRRLRNCYPQLDLYLMTSEAYHEPFTDTPVFTLARPGDRQYDHKIQLDGVVEVDHTGHNGARIHRAEIFWRALMDGIPNAPRLMPEDWYLQLPKESRDKANKYITARGLARGVRERPLIGFQVKGSGPKKTFPFEEVRKFVNLLVERGFDMFLIERDPGCVWQGNHVYSMPNVPTSQMIALCNCLDAMVVMDSGPLWFSHVTERPVPIVCFLGPTRPTERINYHPLWNEGGAVAIRCNERVNLNGTVGCPSCFEKEERCGDTTACLQRVRAEDYIQELETKLRDVIAVGKRVYGA